MTTPPVLSPAELRQFVERGFVKVERCIDRELALDLTRRACERLYCDLDEPATWPVGRMRAPQTVELDAADVAPRAWAAACQLAGGGDRISPPWHWTDHFVVNFGREPDLHWSPPGPDVLPHHKWHTDGDFFRHFLDSPEQGLLVIVLFSDIDVRGGGTQLACDSVDHVARFLADHPEGVRLEEIPADDIVRRCHDFVEATGSIGDVYFMHPLMLHTWSVNERPAARSIINPPVTLRDPMRFDRPDDRAYSPVERATLRALGADRYEFAPAAPRETIVPERVERELREVEERRIAIRGG